MSADARGVSEFSGVAILVAMTVLVTASVGVLVLVGDSQDTGPPRANFSYQHIDSSGVLIVTHERGDAIDAGNLTLRHSSKRVTWAALASTNDTTPIGPGATIQLSSNNAWNENVNAGETVRVLYAPPSGNETVLSKWPEE